MWRLFCGGESQQSLLMLEGDPRSLNGTKVGLGIAAVENQKTAFPRSLDRSTLERGVRNAAPSRGPGRSLELKPSKKERAIPASATALDDACHFIVYNLPRVPSPPLGLVCFRVHLAPFAPAQILGEAPPKSALACSRIKTGCRVDQLHTNRQFK